MAKKKSKKYLCNACGYESINWYGRCPECQNWGTLVEITEEDNKKTNGFNISTTKTIQKLKDVEGNKLERFTSDISEFDIVLGGGIVKGSAVIITAEPGAGKSTILIQTSINVAKNGKTVLYISGEENEAQVKNRASRVSDNNIPDNIYIKAENNLENIKEYIEETNPDLVIVDSIQAIYSNEVDGQMGGSAQSVYCTKKLTSIAKKENRSIFLVGQINKNGEMAGKKEIEHIVDAVIYLEGDRRYQLRTMRAVKNRFGNTDEIGIFQMEERGLIPVENPSEFFTSKREKPIKGCSLGVSLEGTRPIIVEIQSLVKDAVFGNPMRRANGIDRQQLEILVAILEQRAGMLVGNQDVYIKVSGGLRINEPAIDFAVLMSIASYYADTPIDNSVVFIGEVGLTGEIQTVAQIEKRLKEAHRLGYKKVYIPKGSLKRNLNLKGLEIIEIATIKEAVLEFFN